MEKTQPFYKNKIFITLLLIIIFIGLLSFFRLAWTKLSENEIALKIEAGQVDLSELELDDNRILSLDGEWEFYPNALIVSEPQTAKETAEEINVPSGWNDSFNGSPFGYGTYHLKIQVDQELKQFYSLKVASIRDASSVYVNGDLAGNSGKPGSSTAKTDSENIPYVVTVQPDQDGVIDLVIEVANIHYSNKGGITRSLKFGTSPAIKQYNTLSYASQFLVIIIFAIYGFFSFIMYIVGFRNRKLLYFSLMAFAFIIVTSLISDEKIYYLFGTMDIEAAYRLSSIGPVAIVVLLLFTVNYKALTWWRPIHPYVIGVLVIYTVIVAMLDMPQIIKYEQFALILVIILIIVTLVAVLKEIKKNFSDNILLLFAFVAFTHHFVWLFILTIKGTATIYYPFDLIMAVSLFSILFIKRVYESLHRTKLYAGKLEEINDHRNKFLITTSNELKSPLHAILNLLENSLKRDKQTMTPQTVSEMESSLQIGYRLLRIIEDVKDNLNLEKYNPKIFKQAVYVQPVLRSVVDMLGLNITQSQINLKIYLNESTPPIYADENRMIQVFYNVLYQSIENASDSEITVRAIEEETHLELSIQVQGLYLSNDTITRIEQNFEEQYNQALIFERELEIGLRIVKNLINLQAGQLKISSRKKLTTFSISLPLAENHIDIRRHEVENLNLNIMQEEYLEDATLNINETNKPLVMIVETAAYNSLELTSMLSSHAYRYQTAYSGQAGLEKLQEHNVDLLIVNHILKDMSGYQLIEKIRQSYTYNDLPILLVTSNANHAEMLTGFKYGANDYITKPILAEEFNARVRTLITIKQSVDKQLKLEASWLQAQIKPHFIFNVINSIIALSEVDVEKMRFMLEELSELLQYKFKFFNTPRRTTIKEEMNITQTYLEIEKIRFGYRLETEIVIDDEAQHVCVPFLTIEPLVENAIEHGLMKTVLGGKVKVEIKNYENHIEVVVQDDGAGMSEAKVKDLLADDKVQEGVGLINTHQRLKKLYGKGLTIKSKLNVGTKISFTIPK